MFAAGELTRWFNIDLRKGSKLKVLKTRAFIRFTSLTSLKGNILSSDLNLQCLLRLLIAGPGYR